MQSLKQKRKADTLEVKISQYLIKEYNGGRLELFSRYETSDTIVDLRTYSTQTFPNFENSSAIYGPAKLKNGNFLVLGGDTTQMPNDTQLVKASVIELTPSLNFVAQRWYSAKGINMATAIAEDTEGNQYLGAYFCPQMDIGFYGTSDYNFVSTPYLFKLSSEGNLIKEIPLTQVLIYPNPVSNLLQFDAPSTPEKLEIYDTNGKIVLKGKPSIMEERFAFDVSKLAVGAYYLRLYFNGDERFPPTKFLKK